MPFIDVEGARVFWRTDGRPSSPPLVLANSLGSDTSLWDEVLPDFMRSFHVIRVDLPGHGASSVTGSKDAWSVPELASHVLQAADAAGARQFDLVGVSIGGMIGLHVAATTNRVQRLVVSNTAATSDPAVWQERIRLSGDKGLTALVDGTMQRWFSPAFLASDSPRLATIREHFLQVDQRGYAGCCAAIRDLDLQGILPRITARTLVVSGASDAAMPPGAGPAIAGAIPQARHVELAVHHIPHIENPGPFMDAVLGHLEADVPAPNPSGKFLHFVQCMTRLVETASLDEARALEDTGRHLAELVATDDWLPDAFAQPHPQFYQQYLLYGDPLDRFSVVSFVWGPGQRTPIHNHTVWGAIGMLRGSEWGQAFALWDDGKPPLPVGEQERLDPGMVAFVSPSIGDVHQVWNAYPDRTSISIHVYGGNIGRIRRQVFAAQDGAPKEFVSGYSADVVPSLWPR